MIHGTGKQQRNFMHSEDVANAINHLLNKNYNNKVISLLSDQTLNILNLAKKIVKIIKSKSKIKKLNKAKRYDDFNFSSNSDIKEGSKLIWKSKNTIEKNIKLMTKS